MTEQTIILPPANGTNGADAGYRLTVFQPKRHFLTYLRYRWWVVLVCLSLAVVAVLAFEMFQPPKYDSFAQLYVAGRVELGLSLLNEESQTYFGTQIELLKSSRLRSAAYEQALAGARLEDGQGIDVEVVRPMGTSLLQLQATGPDPGLTQRYLVALIDAYLKYREETRTSTAEDVLLSITEELGKRSKSLQNEQDKLAEFQKTNNVVVLEEEAKSAGFYLSELRILQGKLEMERTLMESGIDPRSDNVESALVATAPRDSGGGDESGAGQSRLDDGSADINLYAELRKARLALAETLAEKAASDRPEKHPATRQLEEQITRLSSSVELLEKQLGEERQRTIKNLDARIAAIAAAIPKWEAAVYVANDRLSDGQRLKNAIGREQAYHDRLLGMLDSVDLGNSIAREQVSVLVSPTAGRVKDSNLVLMLVIGVVGGLALSVGLVFIWHMFDDRFVSIYDLRDHFGEMVLGQIPRVAVARKRPDQVLLKERDPRRGYLEAFRHLRSLSLLESDGVTSPKILLVSGVTHGEGKSSVACNLGKVLARSGRRTLLVDGDFYRGRLHHLLGVADRPGLLDHLRGNATAAELIQATDEPGMFLAQGGDPRDDADKLLASPKLGESLGVFRRGFDFVIIDSPPALLVADTTTLAAQADLVFLVVRPFFTRSRYLRQAISLVQRVNGRLPSLVMNCTSADDLAEQYSLNDRSGGRNHRNGGEPKAAASSGAIASPDSKP